MTAIRGGDYGRGDDGAAVPAASALQIGAIVRLVLLLAAIAAGLWMLYALRGVILLLVLSMFGAYLIAPLVEFLCRPIPWSRSGRVLPRAVAIAVVYLAMFGAVGIAAYVVLPLLGAQITEFVRQVPGYVAHVRDQLQAWQHVINPDRLPQDVRDAITRASSSTVEAAGNSVSAGLNGLLPLLGYLPWFVLIPVVAFFLLKDGDAFRSNLLLALPRGRLRGRGAVLFEDINDTLAAYMRAALLGCLLVGVFCTIGFILIGVPYALLFGVVAGLLEFIPLVGPLVVAVGATLVTGFHSIHQAIVVLVFLGALRVARDYVVFPRLVRRGIHLHPLGVILAILSGAELAGVVGIFLAIPVVAVLSVVYRHLLEYRGSTGLVSDLLKQTQSTPVAIPARSEMASAGAPAEILESPKTPAAS